MWKDSSSGFLICLFHAISLGFAYQAYLDKDVWIFTGFQNESNLIDYIASHPLKNINSNFKIVNSTLDEIPFGFFNFVKSKSVTISGIGLKRLTIHSLENAIHVENLTLSKNFVNGLEPGFCRKVPELRILDLSENQIESIQKVFYGCAKLEKLLLQYNHLKSIPGNEFKFLINLKLIDLSFNKIEKLENLIFTQETKIENLILKSNNLKDFVFDFSLSGNITPAESITHLRNLDVSNNQLQFISLQQSLETLDAANNKISKISFNNNGDVIKIIKQLKLSRNNLTADSLKSLENLNHLILLDLSGNLIEATSENFYSNFEILKLLNLSQTGLVNFSNTTFSNMKVLETLDISRNQLKTFDMRILLPLKSLQFLHISDNQLKLIENFELIATFRNFKSLFFMNNDWNCDFLRYSFNVTDVTNITIEYDKPLALDAQNVRGIACFQTDKISTSFTSSRKILKIENKEIASNNDISVLNEKLDRLTNKFENLEKSLLENSNKEPTRSRSENLTIAAAITLILYFVVKIIFFIRGRIQRQGLLRAESYRSVMMPLYEDSV